MVSSIINDDVDETININASKMEKLAPGNYEIVAWDMDTSGKRLYDEICHIAGYTPSTTFQQYILPFNYMNYPATKRHNLKVITKGYYRMLKNVKTHQILKTKSTILALKDFLTWLVKVKGESDGIILIHHEARKINPAILMNTLTKYNLLDEFCHIVKGFANGFDITKAKCDNTIRYYSVRILSRVLLNEKKDTSSADVRASMSYRILHHLSNGEVICQSEIIGNDVGKTKKRIFKFISEFIQPIDNEKNSFESLKVILDRQFSLKPIFINENTTRRERRNITPLRRLLAESKIDYQLLQKAWNDNGQVKGVRELIEKNLLGHDEEKINNISKIIEIYFTSEKLKGAIETLTSEITKKDKKNDEALEKILKKMSGLAIVDSPKESGNKMSIDTGKQEII
ncbi:hypothetical protein HCN44_009998 [Aphidius gifuensis]|uniref:Maternal protein exuperantia n=1 Tax=Aphidius gifuensis TaxID=684658 RepID=A0A834XXF2_APHGI|nr:maternal protein exuperantia [Aphidius gifuensis]XP_044008538.1 maternal protein exuperantia [Aphidius gifuensis]KAF7993412.1 hypothetical protein HCN44_009998 [Aphidius gifuensis]